MNSRCRVLSVALTLTLLSWSTGCWALTYDEGADGDLSGNPVSPTVIGSLDIGSNLLTASSGDGDFDHLGFSLAAGTQLDTIVLTSYGGSTQSFTGLQSGTIWTAGVGGAVNPAVLLGWSHFGTTATGAGVGEDLLDNMSGAAGAIGFATPLGSGTYNMLLQDTGSRTVDYSLTFNVSAIPEPATLGLLALAGIISCASARSWRKR